MMSSEEILKRGGLYYDEIRQQLAIIDPEESGFMEELKEECNAYAALTQEFLTTAKEEVFQMMVGMEKLVEAEKAKVMKKKLTLSCLENQRRKDVLNLLKVYADKKAELNALTIQHDSLLRVYEEMLNFKIR